MISKTEEEISALENEMTKEEVFSDYILMNEKNSELEKLNSNLEEYYDNWTKLVRKNKNKFICSQDLDFRFLIKDFGQLPL